MAIYVLILTLNVVKNNLIYFLWQKNFSTVKQKSEIYLTGLQ